MAIGVGRVGWRDGGPIPRTTLFKDATGITDLTIINALNDLDAGLISTGLDAKIKYLYPFVGGTGDTCKVNFMNPGTKDLTFSGGWTFTSKGIKGNGVNTYANTGISPATNLSQNDVHASIYTSTSQGFETGAYGTFCDFYAGTSGWNSIGIFQYYENFKLYLNSSWADAHANRTLFKLGKKGMRLITRGNANQFKFYQDGVFEQAPITYGGVGTNTTFIEGQATSTSGSPVTTPIYIGALGDGVSYVSNKEYSFATFGKNLTDTDQATLYILVQNFQYALGRIIGTRIVAPIYGIYNPLTQQMISKFNITDTVTINACNNLEQSFIDNGILPLIDVMYLMVGGTSETCAYNFMGNRWHDLDFKGGWTFASTGARGNAINNFANTEWSPAYNTNTGNSSGAFGIYLRTPMRTGYFVGDYPIGLGTGFSGFGFGSNDGAQSSAVRINGTSAINKTWENPVGLYQASRDANDNMLLSSKSAQTSYSGYPTSGKQGLPVVLGAIGYYNGSFQGYCSDREIAFAYLSKGQITQAQQLIINTAVTTFQTALSRNV
jgi:hypothetical protein